MKVAIIAADRAVDLSLCPRPPPGNEANSPTKPGDGFFVTFRVYGPTEALVRKTRKLNAIKKLDEQKQATGTWDSAVGDSPRRSGRRSSLK